MEFSRNCDVTRAIAMYVVKKKGGTSCSMGEVVECGKKIPILRLLISKETGISERELMEKWFEDYYEPSGTLQ